MIYQYPDGDQGGTLRVVDVFGEVHLSAAVSLGTDGRLHIEVAQRPGFPEAYRTDTYHRIQRLVDRARQTYGVFEDAPVTLRGAPL